MLDIVDGWCILIWFGDDAGWNALGGTRLVHSHSLFMCNARSRKCIFSVSNANHTQVTRTTERITNGSQRERERER